MNKESDYKLTVYLKNIFRNEKLWIRHLWIRYTKERISNQVESSEKYIQNTTQRRDKGMENRKETLRDLEDRMKQFRAPRWLVG